MAQERHLLDLLDIFSICLFLFSPVYGYLIGKMGKRRSWAGKKVRLVAAVPTALMGFAAWIAQLIVQHYLQDSQASSTAGFGIAVGAAILAMSIAAKVAGVPPRDPVVDNLSILQEPGNREK